MLILLVILNILLVGSVGCVAYGFGQKRERKLLETSTPLTETPERLSMLWCRGLDNKNGNKAKLGHRFRPIDTARWIGNIDGYFESYAAHDCYCARPGCTALQLNARQRERARETAESRHLTVVPETPKLLPASTSGLVPLLGQGLSNPRSPLPIWLFTDYDLEIVDGVGFVRINGELSTTISDVVQAQRLQDFKMLKDHGDVEAIEAFLASGGENY